MQDADHSPVKPDPRSMVRARFETRLRTLTVTRVTHLTPALIRIDLNGDLTAFQSLGFDDHVKLFFPDPLTGIVTLPQLDVEPDPAAPKPIMRDYTPRRFNVAEGMITLDFAIHEAGPATAWAISAKPGDVLHLGGPRGSNLIPLAFDGYVLIGDDTALPAIARRLEELPEGARVMVLAEVGNNACRIDFQTAANLSVTWVYRQATPQPMALLEALKATHLPQDDVHVWVACEAEQARLLAQRAHRRGGKNRGLILELSRIKLRFKADQYLAICFQNGAFDQGRVGLHQADRPGRVNIGLFSLTQTAKCRACAVQKLFPPHSLSPDFKMCRIYALRLVVVERNLNTIVGKPVARLFHDVAGLDAINSHRKSSLWHYQAEPFCRITAGMVHANIRK
jgi:NADPH-dependent ferric siderophore reductase